VRLQTVFARISIDEKSHARRIDMQNGTIERAIEIFRGKNRTAWSRLPLRDVYLVSSETIDRVIRAISLLFIEEIHRAASRSSLRPARDEHSRQFATIRAADQYRLFTRLMSRASKVAIFSPFEMAALLAH